MGLQIDLLSLVVGAVGAIVLGVVANLLTPYCQSRIRRVQDWRATRSAAAARKRIDELSAELETMRGYMQSHERLSARLGEDTMLLLGVLFRVLGISVAALGMWFVLQPSFAVVVTGIETLALWQRLRMAALLLPPLMALTAAFILTYCASVASRTAQTLTRLRNFDDHEAEVLASIAALEEAAALHGDEPTSPAGEKPGKGVYTCLNCLSKVVLDDDTDTLPPCPRCNGTEYTP